MHFFLMDNVRSQAIQAVCCTSNQRDSSHNKRNTVEYVVKKQNSTNKICCGIVIQIFCFDKSEWQGDSIIEKVTTIEKVRRASFLPLCKNFGQNKPFFFWHKLFRLTAMVWSTDYLKFTNKILSRIDILPQRNELNMTSHIYIDKHNKRVSKMRCTLMYILSKLNYHCKVDTEIKML